MKFGSVAIHTPFPAVHAGVGTVCDDLLYRRPFRGEIVVAGFTCGVGYLFPRGLAEFLPVHLGGI